MYMTGQKYRRAMEQIELSPDQREHLDSGYAPGTAEEKAEESSGPFAAGGGHWPAAC